LDTVIIYFRNPTDRLANIFVTTLNNNSGWYFIFLKFCFIPFIWFFKCFPSINYFNTLCILMIINIKVSTLIIYYLYQDNRMYFFRMKGKSFFINKFHTIQIYHIKTLKYHQSKNVQLYQEKQNNISIN